jgi:hypothetical protein
MLTVLRDNAGFLMAACDWWPVDDDGLWHPNGRYIWVEQLEISPFLDSRGIIRRIIVDIADRVPQAIGAYWERRDQPTNHLHAFRRDQLMKEVKGRC